MINVQFCIVNRLQYKIVTNQLNLKLKLKGVDEKNLEHHN